MKLSSEKLSHFSDTGVGLWCINVSFEAKGTRRVNSVANWVTGKGTNKKQSGWTTLQPNFG
jgi:hypothetical protein